MTHIWEKMVFILFLLDGFPWLCKCSSITYEATEGNAST